MLKYKKLNILLIVALVPFLVSLFVFFEGAEAGEKKEKTYVVGFAQDTMANDWRIAQVRSVERELKKHDFIKFIYT